jgi:hypothetical protein
VSGSRSAPPPPWGGRCAARCPSPWPRGCRRRRRRRPPARGRRRSRPSASRQVTPATRAGVVAPHRAGHGDPLVQARATLHGEVGDALVEDPPGGGRAPRGPVLELGPRQLHDGGAAVDPQAPLGGPPGDAAVRLVDEAEIEQLVDHAGREPVAADLVAGEDGPSRAARRRARRRPAARRPPSLPAPRPPPRRRRAAAVWQRRLSMHWSSRAPADPGRPPRRRHRPAGACPTDVTVTS